MENKPVSTELEALQFCKDNQCKVSFWKESWDKRTPAHVVVRLGLESEIIGKDLVEAVNRTIEAYFTAPVNHDKLSWWEEYRTFYATDFRDK